MTPTRSVSTANRQRLAEFVRTEMARLNVTARGIAARGGPGKDTTLKILAGVRVGPTSIARLDDVLDWAPGSAAAVLEGGSPTRRTIGVMSIEEALRLAQPEQLLAELGRRFGIHREMGADCG
ncbi:hypothetical protein [Cumulibacter soli]|uniref:hypothetical protein n=1 Tax=Cumulibacter soli TaxID=2546344 RepID=UPI001ABA9649|nr:hypothetical protein [Cumulibacter soli]